MEGLHAKKPFAEFVGDRLGDRQFTLLDVGCSGGIDVAWRSFGERLVAYGFDPNVREVQRLSESEKSSSVHYVPGFVGIPPEHPFAVAKGSRPDTHNNPWDRLSVCKTLQLQQEQNAAKSDREKTYINLWREMELADPGRPIHLPDYLESTGIRDVDFIKIDVDGADFAILSSLRETLEAKGVLGVGIEINYIGSDCDTDNTFHNVDRFMRSCGFDLFNLSPPRHYSAAALPSPFLYDMPAQSRTGRVFQSDAFYALDLCADKTRAQKFDGYKKVNLAALFSLAGVPDCAAEILQAFRDELTPVLDVDRGLDLLTEQIREPWVPSMSYDDYMAAYRVSDPMFFRADDYSAHPVDSPAQDEGSSSSQEIHRLRQEISHLQSSRSWRMTAPLRWIMRRLATN